MPLQNRIALFLFFVSSLLYARSLNEIDSLRQIIDNLNGSSKEDADLINKLVRHYSFIDSALTKKYASQSIKISRELSYPEGEINALNFLANSYLQVGNIEYGLSLYEIMYRKADSVESEEGKADALNGLSNYFFIKGDFLKSIEFAKRSESINTSINRLSALAVNYNNLSSALSQVGRDLESLTYLLKSMDLLEELDNKLELMITYINLGVFYYYHGEPQKAMLNYRISLKLNDSSLNRLAERAVCFNNMALIFEESGQLDSASHYYQKGIRIAERIGSKRILGWSYNGLAKVEQKKDNHEDARTLANKALAIRKSVGVNHELAKTYLTSGDCYFLKNDYQRALQDYERGLAIVETANNLLDYRDALIRLARTYEAINDNGKAIAFLNRYIQINDSIVNKEQLIKTAILEREYQFEIERDSIAFEQQKERLVMTSKINKSKLYQMVLLITVFILILAFCAIYYSYTTVRNYNEKLKELNSARSKFLTILTHDLRGPLNNLFDIIYLFKSLVNIGEDPRLAFVINEYEKSALNINHLLDNLLNWGMQEQSIITHHPQKMSLINCIKECLEIYKIQLTSKKLTIKLDEVDSGIIVYADKNSLMTIIRNLVNNAIKYSEVGSKIVLRAIRNQDQAIFSVEDRGVGIPNDQLDKIFKPDRHQSQSTKGTLGEKGAGLGLSLVKDFVEKNNGTIKVESREGEGTSFIVSLPMKEK